MPKTDSEPSVALAVIETAEQAVEAIRGNLVPPLTTAGNLVKFPCMSSSPFPRPWRVIPDPDRGFAVEAANGKLAARYFKSADLAERRIVHGFRDRNFQHRVRFPAGK